VSEGPAQRDSLELDTVRYQLRRGERVLRLEKIPMELLILLAERKDQLVGRQEIIEKLWERTFSSIPNRALIPRSVRFVGP